MFVLPRGPLDTSRPYVIAVCARVFLICSVVLLPVSIVPLAQNWKSTAWAFFTLMLAPVMAYAANRMWEGYDEFFVLGLIASVPLVPFGIGIANIVLCIKGFSASRAWWPEEEEVWGEDAATPAKTWGIGTPNTRPPALPATSPETPAPEPAD